MTKSRSTTPPSKPKSPTPPYRDLADRLAAMGIRENERNIANKLSRGTFTAAYFVQCLDAIECRVLRLREDD